MPVKSVAPATGGQACADVEKAGAASSREAKNARDDIRGAGGNVGDYGALAAAGGPSGGRAGLGEITLARLENDADLMHAGIDAARGGSGASAGRGETASGGGEGEMRGIRDAGYGEGAVVSGDADASGGNELADYETMRRGGLDCCRGRCGSSSAGGGQAGGSGNVGELCAAGNRDDRECAVVAGDADSCDGYGLSGGEAVGGAGGDGDEEAVFAGSVGTGGDGYGGGLRCTIGTGDDGDVHVFVDDGGSGPGAALADTIEIGVVELARQVVPGAAVADGEIFAAEDRCGVCVGAWDETAGDAGQRARRGLLVQNAVRVEQEGAQRGVQSLVRFHVVDGGIAGQRAEEGLQSGTRGHVAVAVDDVLAIGRDSVREVGGRHIGDEAAEDFDGGVE